MRPPGEIRRAALQAAWDVAVERACAPVPGVTRRDVELRLVPAGVARHAVKHTWENLVRAGLLQPLQRVRLPDSSRQQLAYAPVRAPVQAPVQAPMQVHDAEPQPGRGGILMGVTRAWVAAG